jgi:hypothetical protein
VASQDPPVPGLCHRRGSGLETVVSGSHGVGQGLGCICEEEIYLGELETGQLDLKAQLR